MNQTQELLSVKWLPRKRIEARVAFCHSLGLNPEQHATRTLMRYCITHHKWASSKPGLYPDSYVQDKLRALETCIKKQSFILDLRVKFESGHPQEFTTLFFPSLSKQTDWSKSRGADVWNW